MSQANVEIVRRGMEHLLAGRIGEWIETLDPDIGWDISTYRLPDFPDTGSGRDAFLRHMGGYFAGWNDYEATIDELIDSGDDVVVILHERARIGASDAILERQLPMIVTVGDSGTARFARVFKTREEALEAVELSE
jgi:ketosteroid isomerase-like protein